MTPYLNDGDLTLYHGDAISVLQSLPSGIAQTCITSPPYWGLRDYQTGIWAGGDTECDHAAIRTAGGPPGSPKQARSGGSIAVNHATVCRCGAQRTDSQLGLEATPTQYVERLVNVFREVRRVLRDDGTLWLNLAASFMSGDGARLGARNGDRPDTAPQDSRDPDSACPDLCGECAAALSIHTERSNQHHPVDASQPTPTSRGSETPGSVPASLGASPLAAQVSTTPRSAPLPPGECSHCSNCGSCLAVLGSSSRDARLCARRAANTNGTSPLESDGHNRGMDAEGTAWLKYISGKLKPKDQAPIPWMVVMAMIADGWYFRGDVVWAKSNPMPESVTDRPTRSHEFVFLFSKQPRYFYDADAIREPHAESTFKMNPRYGTPDNIKATKENPDVSRGKDVPEGVNGGWDNRYLNPAGRNRRSVWTIPTEPFPEAHFATYPQELVRPCIQAGTSERGECAECGAPWRRMVEREPVAKDRPSGRNWLASTEGVVLGRATEPNNGLSRDEYQRSETTGWEPSCACKGTHCPNCGESWEECVFEAGCPRPRDYAIPARPQLVLDPFLGSGTTALVARKHGRRCIGIDLSLEYLAIAAKRTSQLSLLGGAA